MRSLLDFYEDVLRVPSSRLRVPQDKLVAEGDPADTVKLLELLLGVAVQCQTKETHVQNLMTMEEAVKADLMGSIQNLLAITRAANSAGRRTTPFMCATLVVIDCLSVVSSGR